MEPSSTKHAPAGPQALAASTAFAAVAGDQLALVKLAFEECEVVDAWFDWQPPNVADATVKRTLCGIAAYHGATSVLAFLLERGADANVRSPSDGFTPLHCACAGASNMCYEAIQVLLCAGADKDAMDDNGLKPVDLLVRVMEAAQTGSTACAPADAEYGLDRPEYCTADFRMYGFKVVNCPNPRVHDWTECPFAHPGEKARRRDPRLFRYTGVACPDFRKGSCKRGDICPFAHGVFECWLHPSRYCTQLCKDAPSCTRRVCFFAHHTGDLRTPTDCGLLPPSQSDALVVPEAKPRSADVAEAIQCPKQRVGTASEPSGSACSPLGSSTRSCVAPLLCAMSEEAHVRGSASAASPMSSSALSVCHAGLLGARSDSLPRPSVFGTLDFPGLGAAAPDAPPAALQLPPRGPLLQPSPFAQLPSPVPQPGHAAYDPMAVPGLQQLLLPGTASALGAAASSPFLTAGAYGAQPTALDVATHQLLLHLQLQQQQQQQQAAAAAAAAAVAAAGHLHRIWNPEAAPALNDPHTTAMLAAAVSGGFGATHLAPFGPFSNAGASPFEARELGDGGAGLSKSVFGPGSIQVRV